MQLCLTCCRCLWIAIGVALLALAAAWWAAKPAGQAPPSALQLAQEWSEDYAAFRRQLGSAPDAAWLVQQPNMSAALLAAAAGTGSRQLREVWVAAWRQAVRRDNWEAVRGFRDLFREMAEKLAQERKLLGGGRRRAAAAAAAAEQLRRQLACQLQLLQLAADFAARWAQLQQGWQHPLPGSSGAGAQPQVTDVAADAGHAHSYLLVAHSILSTTAGSAGKPDIIALQAVQFAVLGAAGTLGWNWGHYTNVTQEAQQRFGAAWWQPSAGQRACWEHWGTLRPLYQRGGVGIWGRKPPKQRWWQLGRGEQQPGIAELLETGALGGWVQHLAAAAYEESSAAEVALVAGQLAVLPGSRAVAVNAAGAAGCRWSCPGWLVCLAREVQQPLLSAAQPLRGVPLSTRCVLVFHAACATPALAFSSAPRSHAPPPAHVKWALPANITLQKESAVWSPTFALGATLWSAYCPWLTCSEVHTAATRLRSSARLHFSTLRHALQTSACCLLPMAAGGWWRFHGGPSSTWQPCQTGPSAARRSCGSAPRARQMCTSPPWGSPRGWTPAALRPSSFRQTRPGFSWPGCRLCRAQCAMAQVRRVAASRHMLACCAAQCAWSMAAAATLLPFCDMLCCRWRGGRRVTLASRLKPSRPPVRLALQTLLLWTLWLGSTSTATSPAAGCCLQRTGTWRRPSRSHGGSGRALGASSGSERTRPGRP